MRRIYRAVRFLESRGTTTITSDATKRNAALEPSQSPQPVSTPSTDRQLVMQSPPPAMVPAGQAVALSIGARASDKGRKSISIAQPRARRVASSLLTMHSAKHGWQRGS